MEAVPEPDRTPSAIGPRPGDAPIHAAEAGAMESRADVPQEQLADELAPHLRVVRLLGRGTAASVYLAREPALRRLVAVKVLHPELADDRKARLRFEREAQAAAGISHPNVVAIYRVGALSSDVPFIVMQHVHGRSLADRLKAEGRIAVREVRRILADVASGLEAAHRRRILHRDVKPANVLWEEETRRVLLTDFGIAAILASGDEEAPRLTTRGHVIGDLRYRSPEQLRGDELTELADVYGLGLLGFELLTGEGPFEAGSASELAAAHLERSPRRPSALRPDVGEELERLLLRCLDKVPTHRPSAADVVRQLVATGREARSPRQGPRHPGADPRAPRPEPDGQRRGGGPEPAVAEAAPVIDADARGQPAAGTAGELARETPPEEAIRFETLGALELRAADGRRLLSILSQPKRVALLAYLAVGSSRGFKRRDTLLGVFWPEVEQERARHALRQAVYVLRQGLGADVVVSRGDEEIGLAGDEIWCDAAAFERAIEEARPEQALEWYGGDLLSGFFLSDAPEFERWLEGERQRLRRLASDAAWSLAEERQEADNLAGAAHWARQAAGLSPWDEGSLCRLIEVLDRTGDRAGALRAYERFARRLEEEYEAEPAPETRALIRRVRGR